MKQTDVGKDHDEHSNMKYDVMRYVTKDIYSRSFCKRNYGYTQL